MKPSRVAQALFAAILLVIAVALSAGAGHEDGVATDYTGCVNLNRGVVKFLQAGPTPLEPCPSGWAAIHLSAGDLTQIVSSDGNINVVNGGNGSVTLDLSPLGIADGSVNEPGDPVHWTKLKGIPPGSRMGATRSVGSEESRPSQRAPTSPCPMASLTSSSTCGAEVVAVAVVTKRSRGRSFAVVGAEEAQAVSPGLPCRSSPVRLTR